MERAWCGHSGWGRPRTGPRRLLEANAEQVRRQPLTIGILAVWLFLSAIVAFAVALTICMPTADSIVAESDASGLKQM